MKSGNRIEKRWVLLALALFWAFVLFENNVFDPSSGMIQLRDGLQTGATAPGLFAFLMGTWGIVIILSFAAAVFVNGCGRKEFLLIGLFAGITAIALVPFAMPIDEVTHFFRAYSVSCGRFIQTKTASGLVGDYVPEKLYYVMNRQAESMNLRSLFLNMDEWSGNAGTTANAFYENGYAGYYLPIGYFPAAAGLLLAKMAHLPLFLMIYSGRAANFLFYLLVCYLAFCKMPYYKNVIFLTALNPGAVYLASTYSTDGILICQILLFLSICLKYYFAEESPDEKAQPEKIPAKKARSAGTAVQEAQPEIIPAEKARSAESPVKEAQPEKSEQKSRKNGGIKTYEIILLIISAVFIVSLKTFTYTPILLFFFLFPKKSMSIERRIATIISCLAVFILLGVLQRILLQNFSYNDTRLVASTDTAGQIAYVLQHPIITLRLVLNYLDQHIYFLTGSVKTMQMGAGVEAAARICAVLPIFTVYLTKDRPNGERRHTGLLLLTGMVFLAEVLILILSLYIISSEVGSTEIIGVQSRYMLPLLPFLYLLAAHAPVKGEIRDYNGFVGYMTLFAILTMLITNLVSLM